MIFAEASVELECTIDVRAVLHVDGDEPSELAGAPHEAHVPVVCPLVVEVEAELCRFERDVAVESAGFDLVEHGLVVSSDRLGFLRPTNILAK